MLIVPIIPEWNVHWYTILLGASSGTLYSIKTLVLHLPPDGSLFVVPGTAAVFTLDNLRANGCEQLTALTLK